MVDEAYARRVCEPSTRTMRGNGGGRGRKRACLHRWSTSTPPDRWMPALNAIIITFPRGSSTLPGRPTASSTLSNLLCSVDVLHRHVALISASQPAFSPIIIGSLISLGHISSLTTGHGSQSAARKLDWRVHPELDSAQRAGLVVLDRLRYVFRIALCEAGRVKRVLINPASRTSRSQCDAHDAHRRADGLNIDPDRMVRGRSAVLQGRDRRDRQGPFVTTPTATA